ncbi:MAG: hypothetical protein SCM96_15675 [Acidobacteriota bacterium]|nr:hypothetical protein [Acidobacteriota bacterium]
MNACRIVDCLSRMPLIRPWTGRIVERHLEKCRACAALFLGRDEAKSLLVDAARVGRLGRIRIDAASVPPPGASRRRRLMEGRLSWFPALSGAAAVLVLVVSGFLMLDRLPTPAENGPPAADDGFRISYIKIGGEPANAFIFQPRESDMVIVWVERRP